MLYIIINLVTSIQLVIEKDDVKVLCLMLQTVLQTILCLSFSIVYFPSKWIKIDSDDTASTSGGPVQRKEELLLAHETVSSSSILFQSTL